jgi:glycosyltransferase involved in cell wall biosynthesis
VRRWSRDGEIDFVEVPDYAGWSAGWSRLRVPVISRLHGAATYFAAETGGTVRPLTRWLENRSLHRADFVCSVSRYTARRTEALFRLSSGVDTVLYNPVELPPASEWSARASNRVVFTGTLTAKKGVVELVRAWPLVLERCPDAELHMYGKDTTLENGESMMARLKGALGGRGGAVVWHGHVPREELLAALATARAAVFPSHSESLGIAPLEAMATGCPTVFSERGPGPEVAEHGREILLVNPASEKAIADALVKLLTSDELAARIGAAGRARVAAEFSLDKLVAENEAFFRRCVGA